MNSRSISRLKQAHPRLRELLESAISTYHLRVEITEVARTRERQLELFNAGASKTLNSRHIPKLPAHDWYGKRPVAHAADVCIYVNGKVRWDWPLYRAFGKHVKELALATNVAIVWGGDWPKFRDGPHFELSRAVYP